MSKVKRLRRNVWEISGWWALPILLLASVITVFASPNAGFNGESARIAVSAFIVFVLLNISGTLVVRIAAVTEKPREKIRLTARPIMLLVLVGAIAFARFTEIDPALIIGTVLGVDYGSKLSKSRSAVAVLVGYVWTLALGIAALVGYTVLASVSTIVELPPGVMSDADIAQNAMSGVAPFIMLLGEFCAMLAIAALASGPVSLLPFAFLDGATIYNWNKWVWGVTYLISLTVFSLVLAPLKMSWDLPAGTVAAWILVFVIYAVVAIAVWFAFWLAERKTKEKQPVVEAS